MNPKHLVLQYFMSWETEGDSVVPALLCAVERNNSRLYQAGVIKSDISLLKSQVSITEFLQAKLSSSPGVASCRNKKIVDYSQFGDFENDDEDFACVPAPLNKKSRIVPTETNREKKEKQKRPHKEVTTVPKKTPSKRIALDDKLYQRDLEVALALSVKEPSGDILEMQDSQEQDIKKCEAIELENVDSSSILSNCSADSGLLGPDQVTDDNDIPTGGYRQRRAASKAVSQQKLLTDDSDEGDHADNYEPDFVSDEESEGSSDFSEEDDEDFAAKKKKTKENKRKEIKLKVQTEKEKKPPKSRINATLAPLVSSPRIIQAKSQSTVKKTSSSPEPIGKPLYTSSPSTDKKKPKWIPPAASGCSSNPLGGISVKSPTQGLRLGLSRLARVKPLHPTAASS
ncbi:RAD51-associated protein 1 isoform X3 [Chelonia mydas]|uniref:RAD51-associated protein 1 isoform X3 n=1 Tax=Chelonia mydas TaxID=8469 RepID=UPI0018A1F0E7|nr:RAD51-associated protein 1 isoform X3 [Chelonia mydas]